MPALCANQMAQCPTIQSSALGHRRIINSGCACILVKICAIAGKTLASERFLAIYSPTSLAPFLKKVRQVEMRQAIARVACLSSNQQDKMKTKTIITLTLSLGLWMTLVLGCSLLKKGPISSEGGGSSSTSKDYFPLRVGDSWMYRSTTADGKQSEFTIKVLSEEKENGDPLYLTETVSSFQPIHDWYSKPNGWVLLHREEYVKTGAKSEFQPTRQLLKNPLVSGDSWTWKGKGMMGIEIDESNEVAGPEAVSVAAGKFTAMKVTTKVIQGGAPVTKIYWYAPGVGLVKSMTDTGAVKSNTELLEYSVKP